MKLLIDGRPIREPISGSAIFVLEMVDSLATLGVDPKVFIQTDRGTNKYANMVPIEKSVLTQGNKLFENLIYEIGFNNYTFKGYDNQINHETYFARLPMKYSKLIVTMHDVIPLDHPSWFSWKNSYFAKKNFNRQIANANCCVFSSKFTEDRAHHFGTIKGDSKVIPLAVSEKIHAHRGQYFGLESKPEVRNGVLSNSYILAIGNIEPRKNLPLIAEAISKLNKSLGLDIDFVIAGHPIFGSSDIIVDIQQKLGKDPKLLGFVSEDDKIWLYKNCACHIYASKYEGFGIPPVESIIIGSPTVVANNSSLSELIPSQNIGFVFDSVDDLACKMEANLYKSSHDTIGPSVGEYIDYYRWSRVGSEYVSVYSNLC